MKDYTPVTEVARNSPPLVAGGLTLFGIPLSDVVLLLTAAYTIWLFIEKTPKVLDAIANLWGRIKRRINGS